MNGSKASGGFSCLDPSKIKNSVKFWNDCVLGYIVDYRMLNIATVASVISNKWALDGHITVHKYLDVFVLHCSNDVDKLKIISMSSVVVKGALMVFKGWTPNIPLEYLQFPNSWMWVRVSGLPLEYLNTHVASVVGELFGNASATSYFKDGPQTMCMKLRVCVHLFLPLIPGFFLQLDDGSLMWIQFIYEEVHKYCTRCGRIGHKVNGCEAEQSNIDNGIKSVMGSIRERGFLISEINKKHTLFNLNLRSKKVLPNTRPSRIRLGRYQTPYVLESKPKYKGNNCNLDKEKIDRVFPGSIYALNNQPFTGPIIPVFLEKQETLKTISTQPITENCSRKRKVEMDTPWTRATGDTINIGYMVESYLLRLDKRSCLQDLRVSDVPVTRKNYVDKVEGSRSVSEQIFEDATSIWNACDSEKEDDDKSKNGNGIGDDQQGCAIRNNSENEEVNLFESGNIGYAKEMEEIKTTLGLSVMTLGLSVMTWGESTFKQGTESLPDELLHNTSDSEYDWGMIEEHQAQQHDGANDTHNEAVSLTDSGDHGGLFGDSDQSGNSEDIRVVYGPMESPQPWVVAERREEQEANAREFELMFQMQDDLINEQTKLQQQHDSEQWGLISCSVLVDYVMDAGTVSEGAIHNTQIQEDDEYGRVSRMTRFKKRLPQADLQDNIPTSLGKRKSRSLIVPGAAEKDGNEDEEVTSGVWKKLKQEGRHDTLTNSRLEQWIDELNDGRGVLMEYEGYETDDVGSSTNGFAGIDHDQPPLDP